MIDISELRIGNIVTAPHIEGHFAVERLSSETDPDCDWLNEDSVNRIKCGYVNPIIVTPEWLERLGFVKDKHAFCLNDHFWISCEDDRWEGKDTCLQTYIRVNRVLSDEYDKAYIGVVDPFVHSVQNYVYELFKYPLLVTLDKTI